MENLTYYILALVSALVATASFWWMIVEFVLYLAKDNPFNWYSMIIFWIFVVLGIIFVVIWQSKTFNN